MSQRHHYPPARPKSHLNRFRRPDAAAASVMISVEGSGGFATMMCLPIGASCTPSFVRNTFTKLTVSAPMLTSCLDDAPALKSFNSADQPGGWFSDCRQRTSAVIPKPHYSALLGRRGFIEIDRGRLEQASCECYDIMRRQTDQIVPA